MIEEVKKERQKARESGMPVLRDKSFDLLLEIANKKQPQRILEIGTNTGLTGVALLLTVKNATLTGIEIDESLAEITKNNYRHFAISERAKMFLGDASAIVPVLTGKYDLIFLDGPKGHYYEYLPYLKDILNCGGVLFADDVSFHGYIQGKAPKKHNTIKRSIESYLNDITNDNNFRTTIYDIEDGICVSEKLV